MQSRDHHVTPPCVTLDHQASFYTRSICNAASRFCCFAFCCHCCAISAQTVERVIPSMGGGYDVTSTTIGRYLQCSAITSAAHEAVTNWKQNSTFTRQGSCNHKFCDLAENLYFIDRCWNRRAVCSIRMTTSIAKAQSLPHPLTLIVGQEIAEVEASRPLERGKYVVTLGPATALGIAARSSFSDRLRSQLGVPVVNLGRGGAGPSDYLTAMSAGLTPVLANAAALVIVLMAGRSSANSAYGPEVAAMVRAAGMSRLHSSDPTRAERLRNESLDSALEEYTRLAAGVNAHASAW